MGGAFWGRDEASGGSKDLRCYEQLQYSPGSSFVNTNSFFREDFSNGFQYYFPKMDRALRSPPSSLIFCTSKPDSTAVLVFMDCPILIPRSLGSVGGFGLN